MILQSLSLSPSPPLWFLYPPSAAAAAAAAALVNSVRLGLDRRLYANASRQYLTKLKIKTGWGGWEDTVETLSFFIGGFSQDVPWHSL